MSLDDSLGKKDKATRHLEAVCFQHDHNDGSKKKPTFANGFVYVEVHIQVGPIGFTFDTRLYLRECVIRKLNRQRAPEVRLHYRSKYALAHGNAQRLGLAKALIHNPRLLILDEPANGLDPAGIVEIRELLLELTGGQGRTVFMSSHILAEVSRLAGRIGIIHKGRLLQEMNTDELERNRRKRLLLRARDVEPALRALTAAGQPAEILPDGTIELKTASSVDRPEDINQLLVHAGAPPTHLVVEEEELERYFLRLVGMEGGLQIVVAAWDGALTLVIVILGLVMGAIIQLPGGSIGVILQGSALATIDVCLVSAVVMPFALFASIGRGYLLPMGLAVLTLMMTNLVAILGWGEYFPWAVPGLYVLGKSPLAPISYWIVLLTGLAGMIATYLWWKYADQNR